MATARTYDAATLTASRQEFAELVEYLDQDDNPLSHTLVSLRAALNEMLDD